MAVVKTMTTMTSMAGTKATAVDHVSELDAVHHFSDARLPRRNPSWPRLRGAPGSQVRPRDRLRRSAVVGWPKLPRPASLPFPPQESTKPLPDPPPDPPATTPSPPPAKARPVPGH